MKVGHPTWSVTTAMESRSAPRRSMVSTKFGPPAPNSHEERAIVWTPSAASTARSPSSFVAPYAESGAVGEDST